ncbi:CAMK family protein kinase [Trichomonas vaginalis G3]|uniref:CAMK family protein kinase n=1 Tax=Trichomonas vaginalis (strain ATCC PRA-98 / G3) TaxID=412133 RepID=A2FZ66_TRIV3|nr:protein serine/threonine kinase protein [Trichomonas vaginalis G3]EAX89800.1 CAMK family protein kinase [Trichomonas vaginalis G3]KAI5538364.1 protein serine/threonine kinase protein [Trichomonas vaginalis G3]|eukprot:XP_001302730.1 CAMK family protein kinase [Trichomonas vaginalis G3]
MDPYDDAFFQQNDYQYIQTIGKGTYGIVYLVYSNQYKIHFGVKRVLASKFQENEVESMIAIKSSYVVTLYKYFYIQPYVYMVMEFCPNSIDRIVASPISQPDRILQLASGIIMAVKACHSYGFTHGDIKPSNFLVDSYGRIKICDFGLAKKRVADEISTGFAGTLAFLPPEVIKMQPYDAFAADIWSLGVTLYYVLTKQYPWDISSKEKMLNAIMTGTFDDSNIKNETYEKIIHGCLQVDPASRPSATEISEMLNLKLDSSRRTLNYSSTAHQPLSLILSPSIKKRRLSFQ